MSENIDKEMNDKKAIDMFLRCPNYHIIRFTTKDFFTEVTGGRKLLWCCASDADVAVVCEFAYKDKLDNIIISDVDKRWLMTEWAKDPTVELAFVYGTNTDNDDAALPSFAPLTRRGVLSQVFWVVYEDRQALECNAGKVHKTLEKLSLLGILVSDVSDYNIATPLEKYAYVEGPSGLRYLRWIKDPDLMAKYKRSYQTEYPNMGHTYKSIPDIIQCMEHHGLGGLIVEQENGVKVLSICDLISLYWLTPHRDSENTFCASLHGICSLDDNHFRRITHEWLSFVDFLTFSDCGFNLHTVHGAAVGALMMYCIIDKHLVHSHLRVRDYYYLELSALEKNTEEFLCELVLLAHKVACADNSLPLSARCALQKLADTVIDTGKCPLEDCNVLPMSDGVHFYEQHYRLFRMELADRSFDIIKEAMLHQKNSDEEIAYYLEYAGQHLPALLNEWAAAVSTGTIRKCNLVQVNSFTIHDAMKIVETQAERSSTDNTIHEAYKLLVQIHRGDIVVDKPGVIDNSESNQSQTPAETMFVTIPEYSFDNNANDDICTYHPVENTIAPEGYHFDVRDTSNEMETMPHADMDVDDVCTYLMANGEPFTFRVLNMHCAEGFVFIHLHRLNLSEYEIKTTMASFYRHPDLLIELGMRLMDQKIEKPICVSGYHAHNLLESTSMTMLEAYQCLICLRENPTDAIKLICTKWK